ncbi:hypothetical protein AGR7C_Lc10006 [Agrobacterium deltaense Zutra 3/1]|uniref:Uncharacterized protein n=1 Tax=Agrobacterium deltaense Zutra 3/1 TaxID=1183427 RepID=A0A1S7QN76_9HYPH|nr:hypothetical protein AGR7C_Lc10006 [Agrobacterium deltaense Zutra 3/1]
MGVYPRGYFRVCLRPYIAPLVTIGGRILEVPIALAFNWDVHEPSIMREVGGELRIERSLRQFRE